MEFRYQDGCADPVAQPKSELTALWRATNAAWMLLLPSLAFLAIRQETLEPMHKEYVSYWLLVLDLKTAGWFALPIVAAIVLTITALLQPEIAETPLGRLGLHVARAFALSYCVGIALGSVLIGLIPVVAVLATIVLFRAAVKNPEARQVSALIVLAAITLVYLADAPTEQVRSSNGYLVMPLLTFARFTLHLRLDHSRPPQPNHCAACPDVGLLGDRPRTREHLVLYPQSGTRALQRVAATSRLLRRYRCGERAPPVRRLNPWAWRRIGKQPTSGSQGWRAHTRIACAANTPSNPTCLRPVRTTGCVCSPPPSARCRCGVLDAATNPPHGATTSHHGAAAHASAVGQRHLSLAGDGRGVRAQILA